MKKIFTLLSLALVGLAAQATTYVIQVDDASHVASFTKEGEELTFDADNKITLEIPEGEYYSCVIKTTDPWVLSNESYNETEAWGVNYLYTYFRNNHEFYVNGYSEDTKYYFVTVDNSEIRKNTATINIIGDPAKVSMSNYYSYEEVNITENPFTWHFMDEEGYIAIGSKDYSQNLYKVYHNDEEVIRNYNFQMTLANGDKVDIYTEWPDEEVTVTFEFKGDAGTKSFSQATINGKEVTDFSKPVVAKMGQNINLYLAYTNYTTNSFTINGEAQSVSEWGGSYSGILEGDLSVVLDQTLKECYTANVTVNDCSLIKYMEAGLQNIKPTSNSFTVQVAKDQAAYNPIYFYPIDYTAQIDNCSVDDKPAEFQEYDRAYYVELKEDTKEIVVNASLLDRQDMFAFYFNSPKKASYDSHDIYKLNGFWMSCQFAREDLWPDNIKAGYNFFDFGPMDGQFQFGLYGNEPDIDSNAYIYLNNEKQPSPYYSAPFIFTPNNCDVVKVYITEGVEPSTYTAEFAVEEEGAVLGAYMDMVNPITVADEADFTALQETGFTLLLADGYIVKLNGEQIDPMEEPVLARSEEGTVYYFNLVKDLSVEILKDESGISTIAADDNAADPAVYNILGVKVSNGSTDNLPAGLYIQKGQKFYVK